MQTKIKLLITGLVVAACLQAADNQKLSVQQATNQTIDKLNELTQLTDSQKIAIKKIGDAYFTYMNKANTIEDRHQMIDLKRELNQTFEHKCDSILTETQRAILKAKKQEKSSDYTKQNKNK